MRADASAETLMAVAAHGFAPTHEYDIKGICDSLNYDLIEAFLENGMEVVDIRAAQKAERADLLDLYERYGTDSQDETSAACELMSGDSAEVVRPGGRYPSPWEVYEQYKDKKVDWAKMIVAADRVVKVGVRRSPAQATPFERSAATA